MSTPALDYRRSASLAHVALSSFETTGAAVGEMFPFANVSVLLAAGDRNEAAEDGWEGHAHAHGRAPPREGSRCAENAIRPMAGQAVDRPAYRRDPQAPSAMPRLCGSAVSWVLEYSRTLPSPPVRKRGSKHADWNGSNCRSGRSLCQRRAGKHRILALRTICLRRVALRAGAPIVTRQ
jgi:hypothetical protein